MQFTLRGLVPLLMIFFAFSVVDITCLSSDADARSRSGGRSFSRSRSFTPSPTRKTTTNRSTTRPSSGGFMRGMAGGLLGGAIGSMLFGGLAHGGAGGGFGGSGIGLFQILIFGGIAYFIYKQFFKKQSPAYGRSQTPPFMASSQENATTFAPPPPPGSSGSITVTDGIEMIRQSEPDFDPEHFKEVAQDVFFQVQAGWMRRDIQSYQHLLGQTLIQEYEKQFEEMRQKKQLNKLENIAVRNVELVDAGIDGNEEFISILFTANLLDYTVNETDGSLIEGSMTSPVKFAEKWTWARPIGTELWKLEGITIPE